MKRKEKELKVWWLFFQTQMFVREEKCIENLLRLCNSIPKDGWRKEEKNLKNEAPHNKAKEKKPRGFGVQLHISRWFATAHMLFDRSQKRVERTKTKKNRATFIDRVKKIEKGAFCRSAALSISCIKK